MENYSSASVVKSFSNPKIQIWPDSISLITAAVFWQFCGIFSAHQEKGAAFLAQCV
jgi:hypothetical protein